MCTTLEVLEHELEDLVVRGLSACGPDDVRVLASARDDLDGAGAGHVAGRISDLLTRQQGGDKGAARSLLQLMTSLRVFERVLTLEAVAEVFVEEEATPAAPTRAAPTPLPPAPKLPAAEAKKLLPVLEDLAGAVEDLVAAGLVTASATTKQRLEVSFKEASRLKLGRLAASLRYVVEEIQRFLDGADTFSGKRLSLFLGRTWVLAKGLSQGLVEENDALLARLLLSWPPQPVEQVDVVCVGVRKRLPQGTGVCAFDFHFRLVDDCGPLPKGAPLIWSHIVPRKDAKIPAEALLHLELKPQNFKPLELTKPFAFSFAAANIVVDGKGGGRLMLTADTKVTKGAPFSDWSGLVDFDRGVVKGRVDAHDVGPLDLEVELAVEVAVDVEGVSAVHAGDDVDHAVVDASGFSFVVNLAKTDESKELRETLKNWKKTPPTSPVFGVLHFDRCRLMFQPLSVVGAAKPTHVMLNLSDIDLQALTRSLF